MSERMSEDMSEEMSEDMSKDMSEEMLNFASFFLGPIFLNKRAPNTGEQSAHFQGLKTQKY